MTYESVPPGQGEATLSHMPFRRIATHGHALQLAVGETIKAIKVIRGTLDAAFELNKLIKYSMV